MRPDFCGGANAEKQLAKYAEWHAPRAGMFLWLKLKHVEDSMDIFEELKEAKVVVVPGKLSPLFTHLAHAAGLQAQLCCYSRQRTPGTDTFSSLPYSHIHCHVIPLYQNASSAIACMIGIIGIVGRRWHRRAYNFASICAHVRRSACCEVCRMLLLLHRNHRPLRWS